MTRILLMSDCPPEPGYGSGERTLSIHHALTKLASVDVLIVNCYVHHKGEYVVNLLDHPGGATRWYWRKRHYLFRDFRADKKVAAAVRKLHRQNNYRAFFGRYHLPFSGACTELGPSFVDVDDVPADSWSSRVPFVNDLRSIAFRRALREFKTVFVTKHADVAKIAHDDIRILPCISTRVDQTACNSYDGSLNRILFVGGTVFPPNREGIFRFIEKSLPRIREQVPDAVLRVVGPEGKLTERYPGVSADNFVPDLMSEYRQAKLVVCPIRKGAGSLVKLAEAASYGQAVVATPFAARGYDGILRPGTDLLVAESDDGLADHCVSLLRDEELRSRMAQSARRAAAAHLTQSNVDQTIADAMVKWLVPAADAAAVK